MSKETTPDKTALTAMVKSSLKKAETVVKNQKRANSGVLITSFTFSAIATLVAGITSAAGPVIGSGIEGWRAACILAAFLSFASTLITGVSQQLRINDKLEEASLCAAKLRALDIGLAIGSRPWELATREFEEIVTAYPQVAR